MENAAPETGESRRGDLVTWEVEELDELIDEAATIFALRTRAAISLDTLSQMSREFDSENGFAQPADPARPSSGMTSPGGSLGSLNESVAVASSHNLVSAQQKMNWEAAKSEEISRLKAEVKQLKAEMLQNFGCVSEAHDSIARLQDEAFALRAELDAERRRADRLDGLLAAAKQQAAEERARLSGHEDQTEALRKEVRRLERAEGFLGADLAKCEKDLKASRESNARLQHELLESDAKLAHESNRLLTLSDEKALLSVENSSLKKSLCDANRETTKMRHDNTKLQDKIQELGVAQQKLQLELHSQQGQHTKELNSVNRQLAVAQEQLSLYKVRVAEALPEAAGAELLSLKHQLASVRRKYEELRRAFQMQQHAAASNSSVSFSVRRSRSVTRTSRRSGCPSDEDSGTVGDAVQPKMAAHIRHLENENRLLKLRIETASVLAQEGF